MSSRPPLTSFLLLSSGPILGCFGVGRGTLGMPEFMLLIYVTLRLPDTMPPIMYVFSPTVVGTTLNDSLILTNSDSYWLQVKDESTSLEGFSLTGDHCPTMCGLRLWKWPVLELDLVSYPDNWGFPTDVYPKYWIVTKKLEAWDLVWLAGPNLESPPLKLRLGLSSWGKSSLPFLLGKLETD